MTKAPLKIPTKSVKTEVETPPVEVTSSEAEAPTSSQGEMKLPKTGGVFSRNENGELVREQD